MKRRALVVFGPWLGLVIVLASCTDDLSVGADRAGGPGADGSVLGDASDAASNGGGDGATTFDAGSGDGGSSGSEAGPLEDGGCGVVLAQEGAVVPIQVANDAPPMQTGGTLVPGTYVLTTYHVHGSGPQGTGNARETLVLTGTNAVGAIARLTELAQTTGDFAAHGPLGEHDTFTGDIHSFTIFLSEDCPTSDPSRIFQFTANGPSLTLVEESKATERVYTRIR